MVLSDHLDFAILTSFQNLFLDNKNRCAGRGGSVYPVYTALLMELVKDLINFLLVSSA
jgi:hypothetical protein